MIPQQSPVRHLVKPGDANAVLPRLDVFGHDIHSHFGQIHVRADARGGGDAGLGVDIADDVTGHLLHPFSIGAQIAGDVHEHFVHRIDVDILSRNVFQINTVDFRTHRQVMRHARFGDEHVSSQIRIGRERLRIIRFPRQHTAWSRGATDRVDFLQFRFDFE